MTPLQAMKQALEALEEAVGATTQSRQATANQWAKLGIQSLPCSKEFADAVERGNTAFIQCEAAITNLRTAIEEMEKAEPVAWLYTYAGKPHAAGLKPRESWADHEQHPLYTHPAPIPERLVLVHRDLIAEAFEPTPEPISTDLAKALAAAPKEPTNEQP